MSYANKLQEDKEPSRVSDNNLEPPKKHTQMHKYSHKCVGLTHTTPLVCVFVYLGGCFGRLVDRTMPDTESAG